MSITIRKRFCIVVLLGRVLNIVWANTYPGESLLFPDERTTLDDCHLRFYEFHEQDVRIGNESKYEGMEYPFIQIAAVGWIQPDGKTLFQCGGSLIWDNFVVTAAHCAVDLDNRKPDVVRFSDYNLYSPNDDEFIQEIKIVEIIRHPEHRFSKYYHDIALMRLEKNAIISDKLVPACLWTDNEIRFKQMETAGWGKLGYEKGLSPTLQSAKLSPMSNELCSEFYNNETIRQLKHGLADHHLCAHHYKSDTCEGDSGGPLQVKLMHNVRQTPFIVALTSFGLICGKSVPGVYTKVAPYYDWIIDTMRKRGADVDGRNGSLPYVFPLTRFTRANGTTTNIRKWKPGLFAENTYNMTQCAHRYAKYREFYDGLDKLATNANRRLSHYVFTELHHWPWYMVKLGWHNMEGHDKCYGMILDEDTVLTVADCTDFNGTPVGKIVEPSVIDITKIHIHPRYSKGSSYNNIAVLKLSGLLRFGPGVQFSCIWMAYNWTETKAKVTGIGRTDLITPLLLDADIRSDRTPLMVHSDNSVLNASSCIVSERYLKRMQYGIASEHVCLGNDYFLVPETCDLLIGAPLGYADLREGRYYQHTLALIQFGRDCGFGEHMIATRLASHVDWLSSVLLPDYFTYGGNIVFLNDNLLEGDSCGVEQRKPGRCVSVAECSKDWRKLVAARNVSFCSSASLICCPLEVLENTNRNSVETELERCPILLRELELSFPAGYMVKIGLDVNGMFEFRCLGSVITKQLVLTTASCLSNTLHLVVKPLSNGLTIAVNSTIIHEAYNMTDTTNDIALVKLSEKFVWSSNVYPACLWMNRTHTPLVMKLFKPTDESVLFKYVVSMYNTDCQRTHPFLLSKSQLCAKDPSGATTCIAAGDLLMSEPGDGMVKYLVGLAQLNEDCLSGKYPTFTRISLMVEWIKQFLDPNEEDE